LKLVKLVLKESVVYSIQPILTAGISFILIPIYTEYFSLEMFGNLQYVLSLGLFFQTFLTFGLNTAFWKFRDECTYSENKVSFNIIITQLIIGFTILLFFLCYYLIFSTREKIFLYTLIYFFALVVSIFYTQNLLILQAKHKVFAYLFISVFQFIAIGILNVFFIKYMHFDFLGVLLSYTVAFFLSSILFGRGFIKNLEFSIDITLISSMLKYSFPVLISNIFAVTIAISDRFFLKHLSNDVELGLYSYGMKFGNIINLFVFQPFFKSWNAIRWEIYKRENGKMLFAKINKIQLILFSLGGLFFVNISILLGNFLSKNEGFILGLAVVPIMTVSQVVYSFYYFNLMGILFTDKTKYITLIVSVSSILTIILNFLLIPSFGFLGPSITLLTINLVMLALSRFYSNRFYPVMRNTSLEVFVIFFNVAISFICTYLVLAFKGSIFYTFIVVVVGGLLFFFIVLILDRKIIIEAKSILIMLLTKNIK
jgi:O-antigen/teichoic acid export membrane protein